MSVLFTDPPVDPTLISWLSYAVTVFGGAIVTLVGIHYRSLINRLNEKNRLIDDQQKIIEKLTSESERLKDHYISKFEDLAKLTNEVVIYLKNDTP